MFKTSIISLKGNVKNNTSKDVHKNGIAILENNLAISHKLKYTLQEKVGVNPVTLD